MNEFQHLLYDLMEFTEWDQVELAKRLDVDQSTVSRWVKKGSEPKAAARYKIEQLIKSVGFRGGAARGSRVAVMGKIGAGAEIMPEYEQVPADGLYEVDLNIELPPGAIAFEVDGLSMYPRFLPGDVIVCIESMDTRGGFEAAIRTADGHRYLKTIQRLPDQGFYDLESHNAPAIRNACVVWIAKVHAIFPAGQWHKR